MINSACKICGNALNNLFFEVREMMFGLREKFSYMECSNCKCIQLLQIPEDLDKYYPEDYYSYNGHSENETIRKSFFKTIKRDLKKKLLDNYLEGENLIGRLMKSKFSGYYPWIKQKTIKSTSRILDIGCGSGELLLRMYNDGFRNLTGADPFIAAEIKYNCGIKIYKKQIDELTGAYDVIMMHHAFEHMASPLKVLQTIHRLLAENGILIIRIPVADCFAWRKYGINWVQLDAPRHFFLHTRRSMQILSKQAGFVLEDVVYDSHYLQFAGSEKYVRDVSLREEKNLFSDAEIKKFNSEAEKLNAMNDGDQACFYLKKMS